MKYHEVKTRHCSLVCNSFCNCPYFESSSSAQNVVREHVFCVVFSSHEKVEKEREKISTTTTLIYPVGPHWPKIASFEWETLPPILLIVVSHIFYITLVIFVFCYFQELNYIIFHLCRAYLFCLHRMCKKDIWNISYCVVKLARKNSLSRH